MGQKVNPVSLRIGINRLWDSKWYADKRKYSKTLHQDFAIEKLILKKLKDAGVSKIEILRSPNAVEIEIHSAKPGLIIGRGGETIEALRETLEKKFDNKFSVNINEIKKPNLDAKLLAESIGMQITKRISYRRAAKMAIEKSMEAGAKGVKVRVAGRLNGVEIARNEFFSKGKIPLHTFRADIDYAYYPAWTTYGIIGVKVWIYKGDIFKKDRHVPTTEISMDSNLEAMESPAKMEAPKEEKPEKEAKPKKPVAKKPAAKKSASKSKKTTTKKTTKK